MKQTTPTITGYRAILRRNPGLPKRLRSQMKREIRRFHASGLEMSRLDYRRLWHQEKANVRTV